ncbi:hypothetical protein ACP275_04G156000 [Erythranthe tilingii]
MAETAVESLVEMVTNIVIHYATLIAEAKEQLLELQKDLEPVRACLKEAAEMPDKGPLFKVIEKRMREAIYDVEDALDTCLSRAEAEAEAAATAPAAKPKKRYFMSRGKKAAAGLVTTISMAETVQKLRAELKPIYEDAKNELHNLKTTQAGSGSSAKESLALVKKDESIRRDKVVALEDVEKTIFGYIAEETKALDFISIIGMPGLGKTTLTWKIFDSNTLKGPYRIRIWVNVSQKFNKRDVLLSILKEFTDQNMSGKDNFDLEQDVRRCLKDIKFLIVLDDVWKVRDLQTIRSFLPTNNGEGKVIITSRFEDVGTGVGRREPYNLRFLTPKESWELLQLEVFEDVGECPEELEDVGKEIAKNCDGLPLTIVVIGGILLAKDARKRPIGVRKDEWTEVSEDVIRFLATDKDKRIVEVVALSYDILPDELKECLVYMGVFPEDYDIPAWILIRLWIAEGFILQKEGQTLEKTAEEYLNDLVNRKLVMVSRANQMGENKICGVHDVIHAFCTSKAKEMNFFQEIKPSERGLVPPQIPATEKYHRFCFNSDLSEFLSRETEYPSVRSFLCFYKDPVKLDKDHINAIPDAFQLLRVLNSYSIKFHQFPQTISKLSHLRYVTLYVDNLKVIPESISKLWNLQTLLVDTDSSTVTMSANLWAMLCLRHFKTKAAIVLDQEKEGKGGQNIQTLSTLSPESCTETVANKARNIKELRVRGNLSTLLDGNNNFLEKLRYLEKLKLVHEKSMIRLPKTNCFPKNLKRLSLRKTSLDWSDMSILAQIEKLQVLKLKQNAFTGITWVVSRTFCSLQFLLVSEADLVNWETTADHFPSLTCLSIKKCGKLQKIPLELAKKLQRLEIDSLQKSATDSAKEIQKQKDNHQGEQKTRWGVQFQLSVGSVLNY